MIKDRVVDLFEESRESEAEPYQEDNFLQFLIKQNGKSIDDSFKGKKYKISFLEKVQMEFGVCFPESAYEKTWSLPDFITCIETRRKAQAINLEMAQKRLNQSKKSDSNLLIFMNVLLLPLASISYYLLALPVLANAFLLWHKYQHIQYYKKLMDKISRQGNPSPGVIAKA